VKIAPFGDRAIELSADDATHARRIARAIEHVAGVVDVVVGYDRVVAHLDRAPQIDPFAHAVESLPPAEELVGREHLVSAIYDGPDLDEVATACGLSRAEVVERHAARTYLVEVIGFLPGFAYLGGVDPQIARPRRSTPRTRVEAGSIAIAGERTAIYPLASPGGWNLIARALDFPFDPTRFAIGDRVRFEARC
jgi:UPF0271 protein